MKFKLTKHQAEFLTNKDKFVLLSGGIGSGKSFIGAHYVLKKVYTGEGGVGLIGANSYKQLHNATLATLFSELDSLGIPFTYNQQKGRLKIGNMDIICASLDNFDLLRGVELSWFWLDEVRDTKEEAFIVLMGRLRHKGAKNLEGRLTSSPSGFNWLYDYFAGDKKTEQFRLITATSMDNPYLPDGYIDTLKQSYDSKIYDQEVMGQFINITQGRIYYAFNRHEHMKEFKRDDSQRFWVGMDFNVSPLTAVICQSYDNSIYVWDEIYIESKTHTEEMGKELMRKYGRGLNIVPDSTGKAMKTSGQGKSDHSILRDMGFNVVTHANPFRVDRYNTVNNLFEKGRLIIHPRCIKLIKDLEQVSYKEGSSLPDTRIKDLTHISDALGYLCWYKYPIMRPKSKVGMLPR